MGKSLYQVQLKLNGSLDRLSKGKRSAIGDANGASLGLSQRFRNTVRTSLAKVRVNQNAISLLQTQDHYLQKVQDVVQQMGEVATAAVDDSKSASQRNLLSRQFDQLKEEVSRVVEQGRYNGAEILSRRAVTVWNRLSTTLDFSQADGSQLTTVPLKLGTSALAQGGLSYGFESDGLTTTTVDNTSPTTTADGAYATNEDAALVVAAGSGVLANDSDVDSDALTASLQKDATNGTVTLNADGSFTYVPDANFNGVDTFSYRASDGTAVSDMTTVTINVASVADTPVANDDPHYTIVEGQLTKFSATEGVLINDSDADGDALTASVVTGPANGTLVLNADGSFDYTPDALFTGIDTFTYKVNDGALDSNTATVTLDVVTSGLPAGSRIQIDFTDENGDPAGDVDTPRTFDGTNYLEGPPSNTIITGDASFSYGVWFKTNQTYSTFPSVVGGRLITLYRTNQGQSNLSKMGLGFYGNNQDTLMAFHRDPSGTGTTTTVANTNFDDNQWHFYVMTYDHVSDDVSLYYDGVNIHTDNVGQLTDAGNQFMTVGTFDTGTGWGSFVGEMDDISLFNKALSAAEVAQAMNSSGPNAIDDGTYTVNEDAVLNVAAVSGVLANDSDVNGDPLSAVLIRAPSNGSLTLNADGSFTYTPDADYNGADSFVYRASDGLHNSEQAATVSIDVTAVNDLPVAVDDGAYGAIEDQLLSVSAANGVLANDTDGDGDGLTATLVSTTSNGVLNLNADGSFTYTPNAGYVGTDSFTYQASDGTGSSATRTASIDVTNVTTSVGAGVGAVGDFIVSRDGNRLIYMAETTIAAQSVTAEQTVMALDLRTNTLQQVNLRAAGDTNASNGIAGKSRIAMDDLGDIWVGSRYAATGNTYFVPAKLDAVNMTLDYGWLDTGEWTGGSEASPAVQMHESWSDFAVHDETIYYVDHSSQKVTKQSLFSSGDQKQFLDMDLFTSTTLPDYGLTVTAGNGFHGFSTDGQYMVFEAQETGGANNRVLVVMNTESQQWTTIKTNVSDDLAVTAVSFDRNNNLYWTDATSATLKRARLGGGRMPTVLAVDTIRQATHSGALGVASGAAATMSTGLSVDGGRPLQSDQVADANADLYVADLGLSSAYVDDAESAQKALAKVSRATDIVSAKRAHVGSQLTHYLHESNVLRSHAAHMDEADGLHSDVRADAEMLSVHQLLQHQGVLTRIIGVDKGFRQRIKQILLD